MSRVEMVQCDLEGCEKAEPNGADGWLLVKFDGRMFDLCGAAHEAKWEAELKKLDPSRRKGRKRS